MEIMILICSAVFAVYSTFVIPFLKEKFNVDLTDTAMLIISIWLCLISIKLCRL